MKNKAFTLLELLIVIGIIGVLMALATVAYSSAQIGGRNARRKQDVIAIQNALEQYYSVNSYKYPSGPCTEASTYLKSTWPTDPTSGLDYAGVSDGNQCTATDYCICAVMEASGAGPSASGNSAADCDWAGGKTNYCVGNLQ